MQKKLSSLIRHRRGTWVLLVLFGLLVIGVLFIGLDGTPGLILGYLATTVLLTELTRRWLRIRNFLILFLASLTGIIFLSFLYIEVIYRIAKMIGGIEATQSTLLGFIELVFTYVILFFGPVGMFVGIVGTVILGVVRLFAARSKNSAADNT